MVLWAMAVWGFACLEHNEVVLSLAELSMDGNKCRCHKLISKWLW